jgi:hypothetical protein
MTNPTEVLRFEIPDIASAVRLTRHLGAKWTVLLEERHDVDIVAVLLRPWAGDLAILLREVEGWVEKEGICAIRYELDGRDYVLEAGEPDWSFAPAGELT